MKNLYVTDLDGTLLTGDAKLSDQTRKMLNNLLDDGVNITVASARSVDTIRHILRGLSLKLPIISFNGAYLSDFQTGNHYKVHPILNKELFDLLRPYGVLISLHKDNVDELYKNGPMSEGALKYIEDRERDYPIKINALESIPVAYDVMAYTVIGEKDEILSLKDQLKGMDDIIVDAWEDMYYKPWYWLSIHSKQATKANGIDSLKSYVDVDQLIVFGDNTNDLEMFKIADKGIAVENAVTALKRIADEVIGHHEDDSVAKKIMELERS